MFDGALLFAATIFRAADRLSPHEAVGPVQNKSNVKNNPMVTLT